MRTESTKSKIRHRRLAGFAGAALLLGTAGPPAAAAESRADLSYAWPRASEPAASNPAPTVSVQDVRGCRRTSGHDRFRRALCPSPSGLVLRDVAWLASRPPVAGDPGPARAGRRTAAALRRLEEHLADCPAPRDGPPGPFATSIVQAQTSCSLARLGRARYAYFAALELYLAASRDEASARAAETLAEPLVGLRFDAACGVAAPRATTLVDECHLGPEAMATGALYAAALDLLATTSLEGRREVDRLPPGLQAWWRLRARAGRGTAHPDATGGFDDDRTIKAILTATPARAQASLGGASARIDRTRVGDGCSIRASDVEARDPLLRAVLSRLRCA